MRVCLPVCLYTPFFDTTVGPRPNLAREGREEWTDRGREEGWMGGCEGGRDGPERNRLTS